LRMKENKRKSAVSNKIKRRKCILGFLSVVILVTACLFTPLFNISDIEVTGNSIVTDKEIIKISGIKKNENVFRMNSGKAEKAISENGYIETVRVVKKFPARVVIEITESNEIAYVAFSGNYVGISDKGKVTSITKSSKLKPKKMIISGFGVKSAQVSQPIEGKKQEKTELVRELLEALQSNKLASFVKKADISDTQNILLVLTNGTEIIIGKNEQMDYKLKCLNTVLEELGEIRGGKINLSDPTDIIYEGGD